MKDLTLTRPSTLYIEYESTRAIALVIVSGAIDAASAPHLLTAIEGQLETGPKVLAVDLQGTMYVDPAGIAALIAAAQLTQARGIRFRLMNLTEHVRSLPSLARLEGICELSSSEDDLERTIAPSSRQAN